MTVNIGFRRLTDATTDAEGAERSCLEQSLTILDTGTQWDFSRDAGQTRLGA